ncbi:FxSxx-COOH system tetratricopeptide repeat protein [Dactylosporangium sp. NPDC005572]|uniref:FxSxx-COOH system tetratricopeptide repeat protein n=1 Tax=Dactylosporangium sp. NPDC005572 TaxID=3156889 RepID=UPI0033A1ECDC
MPAETGPRNGRVITFYSYKGGCGRTMALANTAWALASNGYRVLAIDWDLESPGLHRYFQPFMRDPDLRRTEGLIELLQKYCNAAQAEVVGDDWMAEATRLSSASFSLKWPWTFPGVLDFIPAGKQDNQYSPKVSNFDWHLFWDKFAGEAFVRALGEAMRRDYDFVLVDSRTGLSDSAGILTMLLPDAVVNCFALNRQGVEGALMVAHTIDGAERDIAIYPLPGRVESGEQAKLQHGRDEAQRKFRQFTDKLDRDVEDYWSAVEVPYKPYYAYEEILAVFADRPKDASSVLAPYVALAGMLAGKPLVAPEIPEKQRRSVLAQFERSGSSAQLRVLVQYAAIDRVWAEWIRQELDYHGHKCGLIPPGSDTPALDGVDKVVVLVSNDGLTYETIDRHWRPWLERVDLRSADLLVPMRVNGPPLPVSTAVAASVDFATLKGEAAVQEVFKALGVRFVSSDDGHVEGDIIRYPAEHAKTWRVPIRRNPGFVGRDVDVERLRDQLSQQDAPVALVGMSGVGKSTLALEYLYRYAAAYDNVWWISADSEELARSGFEELGDALGVPQSREPGGRVAWILEELRESQSRWLVVLDNAGDPAQLAQYVPEGAGNTIITSRDAAWSRHVQVQPVDVFRRHESITLFDRRNAGLTGNEADTLAERLGDLPVAIEASAQWLVTTAGTVEEFLERMDRHGEAALAAFAVAMESLRAQNRAAARLVEIFAFLAATPIPNAILRSQRIRTVLAEHDATLRDPLLLSHLVQQAGRFGLVKSDPASRTISMHVLIQQEIRRHLDPAAQAESHAVALEAIAEINPGDADNATNWPRYELLRPHVDVLRAAEDSTPAVRRLIIDLVRYLRMRGQAAACEQLAERALAAWAATIDDPDDIDTILLRFQYANVVRDFGKLQQAYEIDLDLLERLTRVEGEAHPYTLMVAGSYAQDLREQGRWAEAQAREEQTYTLIEHVLGDEHPRTLMAANNYALTLRLAGRYSDACDLDREIHRKRRSLLGDSNPFTLSSADALGTDERDLGDLQGSRRRLEAVYEASKQILGDEHPSTLMTMRNLATTYRWLGKADQAATLLDSALPRFERVLGAEHPATVGCRVEKANVLSDQGDDWGALRLVTAAERSYEAQFAIDHPLRLVARNNLAVFARKTGDTARGRKIAEEVAVAFAAKLGADHTITALALVNVANAAAAGGDLEHARRTDERAYKILETTLRPENIASIGAMMNYAVGRIATGNYDETYWAKAVQYAQEVLGPDHPITLRGQSKQRIDLDLEPFVM